MAFDSKGAIYVRSYGTDGKGHILRTTGGCAAAEFTELTTMSTLGEVGGIAFNAANRLVISDPSDDTLYTYARPVGNSLGAPNVTTTVQDGSSVFAFRGDGNALWMIGESRVCEYAYPTGGAPIGCLAQANEIIAVAVIPALVR